MRRVPLKIVEFRGPNNEEAPNLHYSEVIVLVVRGREGLTAAEMGTPLAIIDAVTAACETAPEDPGPGDQERSVFLEEAEWSWLVERLNTRPWPFVSRVFTDLVDAVAAAPKIDPNAFNGGLSGRVDREAAVAAANQAALGAA